MRHSNSEIRHLARRNALSQGAQFRSTGQGLSHPPAGLVQLVLFDLFDRAGPGDSGTGFSFLCARVGVSSFVESTLTVDTEIESNHSGKRRGHTC